jgi:recombination protein RecA
MASAALGRLETLLQARKLDGTVSRSWRDGLAFPSASSGNSDVDRQLGGGWRRGEVSEAIGPRGSGRTSLLVSTLAAATARDEVVAIIDAVDRFDPVSAALAGVDLDRVLWVRGASIGVESARPSVVEHAVHQAVRALDLVVRAGGFGVVALDLADLPPRAVRALPFATWLRVAHVLEGRDTACLLIGEGQIGRSPKGATVQLSGEQIWTGTSPQARRFTGIKPLVHKSC